MHRTIAVPAFLIVAFAGCTSYVKGGEVEVPARDIPKPALAQRRAARPFELSPADPVYAAPAKKDNWVPDLTPIRRAVWAPGAPIAERLQPMGRVTRITVHHEGMPAPNFHTAMEDVIADLREIRKVHIRDMNAGDIGYHFIIDPAGRIWEGRPVQYQGAHAGGEANAGNVGIMLLGNFDLQMPSTRQLKTLDSFLALLMARYGLSAAHLFTHGELRPTRCPGRNLEAHVTALRAKM
jgi:hypothetical protein